MARLIPAAMHRIITNAFNLGLHSMPRLVSFFVSGDESVDIIWILYGSNGD